MFEQLDCPITSCCTTFMAPLNICVCQNKLSVVTEKLMKLESEKTDLKMEMETLTSILKQKEGDVELVKEELCETLHQRSESCKKLRSLAEVFSSRWAGEATYMSILT